MSRFGVTCPVKWSIAACTPPSCTSTCALASRRSVDARWSAAPLSGNSQNAEIEIRGTGRSCGAAPNGSSPLPAFPIAIACDMENSNWLVADVAQLGRLVFGLLRSGRLCFLVGSHHSLAARGVARIHPARRNEIARVGNHCRDIVLNRAAEIGPRQIGCRVARVFAPVSAGIGAGVIGDVADLHPGVA